ncbi:MAG TPA: 3-isopropylmalate dehydratase small subunit [Steroidobacter sp.]|uniref:3-isopropylmalate dehydratase small subunit n=1 Tax=Steroidobacter sp. TaxID=1978227 RepID=UPI002EDA936F
MRKFVVHRGVAAPLLRANIDTDAIIPSREMKHVSKTGLADGLFAGWRYLNPDTRTPDPSFVLNHEDFAKASILIAGANFGCGSSREHAVWALAEFGIRAIIAPSFGAIFQNNCIRNGLLPAVLDEGSVRRLADVADRGPLVVDLERCVIVAPDGSEYRFDIAPGDREMLLQGIDAVEATLRRKDQIEAFEARDRERRPWMHLGKGGPLS